jgi:hypothetical protein
MLHKRVGHLQFTVGCRSNIDVKLLDGHRNTLFVFAGIYRAKATLGAKDYIGVKSPSTTRKANI